jgi:hypothetical protein
MPMPNSDMDEDDAITDWGPEIATHGLRACLALGSPGYSGTYWP